MSPLLAAEPFTPYGPSHWAAVGLFVVGAVALVLLGRRLRDTAAAQHFSRGFAVAIVAFQLPIQVYSMSPGQWDLGSSLPLQLCDLAWMAAIVALWTHRLWAFALTYYWGLTLTLQAFLTPELGGFDFPHVHYIAFWGMHCLIVWAPVYLVWGLGFRPDWRRYGVTVAATLCWGVVTLAFNDVADANYGFLNAKPSGGSLLDLLGPWPWYLLSAIVLGAAVWALITWPWVRRRGADLPGDASAGGRHSVPTRRRSTA